MLGPAASAEWHERRARRMRQQSFGLEASSLNVERLKNLQSCSALPLPPRASSPPRHAAGPHRPAQVQRSLEAERQTALLDRTNSADLAMAKILFF